MARRVIDGAVSRVTTLNGLPALVTELAKPGKGQAALLVTAIALDDAGRIARVYSVLATRKLTALR